jgi:predicted RNA-binding protein with PIN domain
MSLQYVIDGYNIINHPQFNRKSRSSSGPCSRLLSFIRQNRLTGSPKNKVIVVFDGYPLSEDTLPPDCAVNVVFSRKISADEKIKRIVEESAGRKNMVVVSDDKEIRFLVRPLGVRLMSVEEFIAPKDKSAARRPKDIEAQELTYTQMHKINEELRKIWLE